MGNNYYFALLLVCILTAPVFSPVQACSASGGSRPDYFCGYKKWTDDCWRNVMQQLQVGLSSSLLSDVVFLVGDAEHY